MKRTWHLVTCEYPPQIGGVSDHTRLLARELHKAGDDVHVWAPELTTTQILEEPGITVHRTLGDFSKAFLADTRKHIAAIPMSDAEIFVQWVPHGYGYRSMNMGFVRWLEDLAQAGYPISLMVHEPYLESRGSWKQRLVARIHRRMIRKVLGAATRVFVSIPAWERYLAPYAPSNTVFEWLPIPATVPVAVDYEATSAIRARYGNTDIIGHLGTYSKEVGSLLAPAIASILTELPTCHVLLMGNGGERFSAEFIHQHPKLATRVHAVGLLSEIVLSRHLKACDLVLQPYPDGLSTRRTSLMNVLSHGVAVVTNAGHLTEDFWSGSKAVSIVNPQELASECVRLLRNPAARQQLAHEGLHLYHSRFDWPRTTEKVRKPQGVAMSSTK
jgi:glycosyltransferase involved in cell wall biosynthesis